MFCHYVYESLRITFYVLLTYAETPPREVYVRWILEHVRMQMPRSEVWSAPLTLKRSLGRFGVTPPPTSAPERSLILLSVPRVLPFLEICMNGILGCIAFCSI